MCRESAQQQLTRRSTAICHTSSCGQLLHLARCILYTLQSALLILSTLARFNAVHTEHPAPIAILIGHNSLQTLDTTALLLLQVFSVALHGRLGAHVLQEAC
jgi:hypothetical protein